VSDRFEHKNNTGSLFRNQYKTKDNQPDHKGTAKIDGKEFDIGAWINTDKNGQKYFGFTFEAINPEPVKPENPEPKPVTPSKGEGEGEKDIDKQIPF